MKNVHKNSIYPSVPFSCMTNQPIHAVYMETHLWHLKGLNLELHFEPLVQMDLFQVEC